MNKKMFRFILAGLLIASISFIGACSSEETSQPQKKITLPQHEQETKAMPTTPPAEKNATIEETPIVDPPVGMPAEGEKAGMTGEQETTEPDQGFENIEEPTQEPGLEEVPPAPESESEVMEETGTAEGDEGLSETTGTSTPQ